MSSLVKVKPPESFEASDPSPTVANVGSSRKYVSSTRQKRLGAFYTPRKMADTLVQWAIRDSDDTVLDPSFGGLVFLEAARDRLLDLGTAPAAAAAQLSGVDLDEDAHAAVRARAVLGVAEDRLLLGDFFGMEAGSHLPPCDAAVGNPPYIRYQGWKDSAAGRRLSAAAGVTLTRLASSWAPFVVHTTSFVAPGGRLAQVLPAEILHAQYAARIIDFLCDNFGRVSLAVFEQRVFPGALEEVVLLFASERAHGQADQVEVLECQALDDLDTERLRRGRPKPGPRQTASGRRKLLAQLLPAETTELYDRLSGAGTELGGRASVDIGAVTGSNNFFLLSRSEAEQVPRELLYPTVSKATQIRGARFSVSDVEALASRGAKTEMFVASSTTPAALLTRARGYLEHGEAIEVPARYKCRQRSPWWAVPLPKRGPPHLFLTYCSSEHPRLPLNEAEALNTNTVHGVYLRDPAEALRLAVGFYNSLTLLSCELEGRSYGGGVLKLEPTEAEAITLPPLPAELDGLLGQVDDLLRQSRLDRILDLVDPLVLGPLGLSKAEMASLRGGAERLRSRRRSRGKPPREESRGQAELWSDQRAATA